MKLYFGTIKSTNAHLNYQLKYLETLLDDFTLQPDAMLFSLLEVMGRVKGQWFLLADCCIILHGTDFDEILYFRFFFFENISRKFKFH